MTIHKCREVLRRYERELPEEQRRLRRQYDPVFDHFSTMLPRMHAMLDDVEATGNQYAVVNMPRMEKFMRWLGFLQGAMWANGLYSIDELKSHNKPEGEPFRHER